VEGNPGIAMLSPILLSLSALAAPDQGYTQADVLRLRSSASTESSIVARVPINTRVSVLAEDGARLQIRSETQPDVVGWIDAVYLDERPLTAPQALKASQQAEDTVARVVWIERALAISPTREVVEEAERVATQLSTEDAETLRLHIATASASWFAWCEDGRATLLGRMDGGAWTYAVDVYPNQGEPKPWGRRLPAGLDAIAFTSGWRQTHFPAPRLIEVSPAMDDEDSSTGDLVDLGSCSEPGLMASPAAQLQVIRKSARSGRLLREEPTALEGVEYAQRVEERLVEGYRTTMKPFFGCGADTEVGSAVEVGIFDTDGHALRPFGQQKDSDIGHPPFSITHSSWLRFQVNGERMMVFTAGEGHPLSTAAWMVFVHPDGSTDAQLLVVRRHGC